MNKLQQRIAQSKKDEGGFTLIELLIVIVILGILAAIVVFSVGGITDRGATSACKATREQLNTAGEAYRATTGSYPTSFGQISPAFINTGASTSTATSATVQTIQDRATNPQWQVTITFTNASTPPAVAAVLPSATCA